ncbi:MAG: DUF192 domain-containing protein, partial [Proteobacteria bacterium]|nr:DUF192 domain-containing protein [Pseudomonadota bacterium]
RIRIRERIDVQVEIVSSDEEQILGLGNRFSLPEGTGMLFVYDGVGERIFWMKRMNFPIDIVWISRGRIVHIENRVAPPSPKTKDRFLRRYGHGISADMVLELPAGFADKNSLSPGDKIELYP